MELVKGEISYVNQMQIMSDKMAFDDGSISLQIALKSPCLQAGCLSFMRAERKGKTERKKEPGNRKK